MATSKRPSNDAVARTPEAPTFVIEPAWRTYRYMFDDGETLDVLSPNRADSTDRERVLAEATRRFGKRAERKIAAVVTLPTSDT